MTAIADYFNDSVKSFMKTGWTQIFTDLILKGKSR